MDLYVTIPIETKSVGETNCSRGIGETTGYRFDELLHES